MRNHASFRLLRSLPWVLPSLCAPLHAQASAAPAAVDLRLERRVGEPVRGLLEHQMKGTVEVSANGKTMKLPLELSTRLEFVDEFLSLDAPAPGDFEARRTYVAWQSDEKGKGARDNELSGVRASMHRRSGEYGVEVDRLARKDELQRLLEHDVTLLGCELPERVEPGASFAIEPAALAFLLVDEEQAMASAKGSFKLSGIDEAGLATLEGELMALTKEEDAADPHHAVYEGTCSLVVDTHARRLVSAAWKGKTSLFGQLEGASVKGSGTFDSRLTLAAGAPAREALARKVVYRDVRREPDGLPFTLELPSHWFEREVEEGKMFSTGLHGDALITLEFRLFEVERGKHEAAMAEVLAEVKKELKLDDEQVVPSPLGKGRSARLPAQKDEDGQPFETLLEFYPCGPDLLLRVRLQGEPKGFAKELKAWPDIKQSMRKRE